MNTEPEMQCSGGLNSRHTKQTASSFHFLWEIHSKLNIVMGIVRDLGDFSRSPLLSVRTFLLTALTGQRQTYFRRKQNMSVCQVVLHTSEGP